MSRISTIFVIGSKSGIVLYYIGLRSLNRLDLLHNAGTNGCHLRTVVGAGDGSDGISAECRTGHQQLIVFLLLSLFCHQGEITDIQLGAVPQSGR